MAEGTEVKRGFRLVQILLESAGFAHREDYLTVPPETKDPGGKVAFAVEIGIGEGPSLAFVRLTVDNSSPENSTALYNFEVVVIAILELIGTPPQNEDELKALSINGTSILVPFAREAIASLTGRGRFGPVLLQPVNTAALLGKAPLTSVTETDEAHAARIPAFATRDDVVRRAQKAGAGKQSATPQKSKKR